MIMKYRYVFLMFLAFYCRMLPDMYLLFYELYELYELYE